MPPVTVTEAKGFNTQPPEGGWTASKTSWAIPCGFNTQPPEGGCSINSQHEAISTVSIHSRLKAAVQARK